MDEYSEEELRNFQDSFRVPYGAAMQRPIDEVAAECVRDGVAHFFYADLAEAYAMDKSPSAADAQWTDCDRYIDIAVFAGARLLLRRRHLANPVSLKGFGY
jgi:hypothetical protein